MYFVIGGRCSGKREYVKKHFGIDPKSVFDGDFSGAVYGVPAYVRSVMERCGDVGRCAVELCKADVVISEEVGCGVVPADGFERRWRDCVGDVNKQLAERAEGVIRVVCGIGVKLK